MHVIETSLMIGQPQLNQSRLSYFISQPSKILNWIIMQVINQTYVGNVPAKGHTQWRLLSQQPGLYDRVGGFLSPLKCIRDDTDNRRTFGNNPKNSVLLLLHSLTPPGRPSCLTRVVRVSVCVCVCVYLWAVVWFHYPISCLFLLPLITWCRSLLFFC